MREILKKIFAVVVMLTLICGVATVNGSVNAAVSKQNIFTEELEEDLLEDSNKWVLAKEDTTAIGIKNVGRTTMRLDQGTGATANSLLYTEKVTLQENQYAEYSVTVENMPATAVIDFRFSADRFESSAAGIAYEGISLYGDPGWLRGVLTSSNAQTLSGGWGNSCAAAEVLGLSWVNGNALLGASNIVNGSYKIKARFYGDGTVVYMVANAYSDNWFATAFTGVDLPAWTTGTGLAAVSEGYLSMFVRNAATFNVGEAEVAIYSYETKCDGIVGFYNGTLVESSKYTESFTEGASKMSALEGTVTIAPATKAILVDNAANDDLLIKKTALSKPENNFADTIYDLQTKLILAELAGNAKAVMYLGGDSQSDFSASTKLEFSKNAEGAVVLTVGGKFATTAIEIGSSFDLHVVCGSDNVNEILIDGIAVAVSETETLMFEKTLSEKFIALGTTGVTETDKAAIGVVSAAFKKYNYQQGTGGDFTETFEDGKYNEANLSFSYAVDNLQDFFYADKENCSVVIDKVGYSGVISTKQSYGDFEFVFEISELMMNHVEEGEDLPTNFLISWGRPSAESDYAAGGCGLYLVYGCDLNIMGDLTSGVSYAPGYNAWFTVDLPTDKTGEDGQPLESAVTIWDYNFSEGNLVFKTVKTGTTVSVYMYTANCPEDDASRTTPICVIINDYSAAGMVGICGVPTGKNISMKLDSFLIKNLDEHQAENLVIGTDADIVDLDFTPDEPDEPIKDPFEENPTDPTDPIDPSKPNKPSDGSSCNNSASAAFAIITLAAIVLVKIKKA